MPLLRFKTIEDVRGLVRGYRAAGARVALVPTMGALHDGHLALVRLGRERCDRVVASIFVNPRQFAAGEDFTRYPRDLDGDVAKLAEAGCDGVWAPGVEDVYPDGFATRVEVGGAGLGLEADVRPQHFSGVATVCLKLFSAVAPDIAVFGEKDYQQLCVLRQMVRDFDLPLDIIAGETVREGDGLAMSSRNAYLSAEQRRTAPALARAIRRLAGDIRAGADLAALIERANGDIRAAGFDGVDYVAVRDAEKLSEAVLGQNRVLRVLAAARLGTVRLIDNVPVP